MPFTLAHPAAIVPLARRGLVLSALAVGSMVPDFPLFLGLGTDRGVDHSIPAVFLLGIPAGLIVLWIYQVILKRPLLSLLPARHQQRLAPLADSFTFGPASRFLLIVLSLIIGAFTHLAWDSFTHVSGWGVQHIPILAAPLIRVAGTPLPAYKLLQYGSAVLGIAVLVYWYLAWIGQASGRPLSLMDQLVDVKRGVLALGAGFSMLVLAAIYAWQQVGEIASLPVLKVFAKQTVLIGVWLILAEAVVFSAAWYAVTWRER